MARPPVPSVWRLAWLLFMQPVALHRMYQVWGLKDDLSLIVLWTRARDPVIRALMARYALLLLVAAPLMALLAVSALTLSGVPVFRIPESAPVAEGMVVVLSIGLTIGVAFTAAGGIAICLVYSVVLYFTFHIAFLAAGDLAPKLSITSMASSLIYSTRVGVAGGISIIAAFIVSSISAFVIGTSVKDGKVSGVAKALAYIVAIGMIFAALRGGDYAGEYIVAFFVPFGVAVGVVVVRLPVWLAEAFLTQWLAWRMRHRPDTARRLAVWLPLRYDDLIYLPLPGLYACLIQVAEEDPDLGKELIALAATSIGQRRIAPRALVEIQARDLERTARDRAFARVAELKLPFIPKEADLVTEPANAPLRRFHDAARDIVAGGTNHHQRRLALERARSSLESLRNTTVGSGAQAPLARRLLSTATVWLDAIREEEDKLKRQAAERPEIPIAFVAGPPLTPERTEDRTLFRGRADIIRLIGHDLAPDRRGVLLVVGQRRMGKTSLGNWLPTFLGTGTTVVSSNFQPLSGDLHRETPHRRVLGDVARSVEASMPPESTHWGDGLRWLEKIDRTRADQKILVTIDEVEQVQKGIEAGWCSPDFLDFLRAAGDALQNIRFLLLTAYPLHRLGPHWTDRLVSVTSRTISYLDEKDARELLTHPIPNFPGIYPNGGVDLILKQTGRHPFLLQKAGDDLCRLLNSRGGFRLATHDDLEKVFDDMARELPLFDEIWRSRTEDEHATLRRLAPSDEPGDRDPAATQLEREGYLERRGDKVTFAVPLFREWIRMNKI